jgi:hypothetical protein
MHAEPFQIRNFIDREFFGLGSARVLAFANFFDSRKVLGASESAFDVG